MRTKWTRLLIGTMAITIVACHHSHESGGHDHAHDDVDTAKHQKHEGHHHHHDANAYMNESKFKELVERFESPERDAYQQPTKVMDYLGELSGQTIMDIGAGTGYFSFKLVEAGAKVIAADVDERFQAYIQHKRDSLRITAEQLSLRKVPFDAPNLAEGEVDRVLIVNTYHHIADRSEYFSKVKAGLTAGGSLHVIDFKKEEMPVGPPLAMKMAPEQVIAELKAAGFSEFEVNNDLLEYQYLILAR